MCGLFFCVSKFGCSNGLFRIVTGSVIIWVALTEHTWKILWEPGTLLSPMDPSPFGPSLPLSPSPFFFFLFFWSFVGGFGISEDWCKLVRACFGKQVAWLRWTTLDKIMVWWWNNVISFLHLILTLYQGPARCTPPTPRSEVNKLRKLTHELQRGIKTKQNLKWALLVRCMEEFGQD